MSISWNRAFSELVRQSQPGHWGNWSLNPEIAPGVIGIVDPATGDFRAIAEPLPDSKVIRADVSARWELASAHVSRTEVDVALEGKGADVEQGIEAEGALSVGWSFEKAGSLVSEFSLSHVTRLESPGDLVHRNLDRFAHEAESVSMGSHGNIAQGFGVVTSVLWARSGLNLGAHEDQTTFSIEGKANAVKAMLGEAEGSAGYSKVTTNRELDRHMWPDAEDAEAATEVPIAFTFGSFDGKLFIPNWIRHLGSFTIVLNNVPGCTYIVDAELRYQTPTGAVTRKTSVSGGLTQTFGDIPLTAWDLNLHLKFHGILHSDTYNLPWREPLGEWSTGVRHIDLKGVWPGKTHCIEREANL